MPNLFELIDKVAVTISGHDEKKHLVLIDRSKVRI